MNRLPTTVSNHPKYVERLPEIRRASELEMPTNLTTLGSRPAGPSEIHLEPDPEAHQSGTCST
ncbi:MAG: hypothetical protein ACK58L_01700 [Planctomycetota bacterium]